MGSVIWVTGAHGFIGRHVAYEAAKQGMTVLGIGHGHWPIDEAQEWGITHWLNGNIIPSNLHALQEVAGNPDLVIHLAGGSSVGAAIAHPREDFFRTVTSTVELLEWLRSHSPETSVVAVSSAAVYGADHDGLISEAAVERPFSPYGFHKQMMESLCRSYAASYGLHFVVARLFSVYGNGLQKQLLWDICSRLKSQPKRLELGGTGEELRDWVHVSDVAKVLASLGTQASINVPVFNVGRGVATSVREIAEILTQCWYKAGGRKVEIYFNGCSRQGDPFSLVADTQRLADVNMYCLRSVDEGISAYVEWFRSRESKLNL